MVNIKEFHTKVFEYLHSLRNEKLHDPNLTYTYRKSNYGGRLETGYWFYGNDNYFCVSFWSGMDWKNRTPNIGWFFLENGDCQLEINISDSYEKEKFVEDHLIKTIDGLYREGRKYVKRYGNEENAGIDFLDLFIHGFERNYEISDKAKIDFAINQYGLNYFDSKDENKIGFISESEFNLREKKVLSYKKILEEDNEESFFQSEKSNRIKNISIYKYFDIDQINIIDIPKTAQWIFLIGENGSGKTTFLKALSTVLGYRTLEKEELTKNPNFECVFEFYEKKKSSDSYINIRQANENCHFRYPMVSGLVILGPNRLISYQDTKRDRQKFEIQLKKENRFTPLWDFEYRMLDIEDQLDIWFKDSKKLKFDLDDRMYFIRSAFVQTVPGLYDIRFSKEYSTGRKRKNLKTTFYLESDKELEKGWQELPSGTRSIFALVGEIIIRLSNFQKDVVDPSELQGIAIIDEIDLHLHPKAQRELIQNLSETFRNVQFIVATHSPTPILGFKGAGVILHVSRNNNGKITVERLRHIEEEIQHLTPNQLLSSELFGGTSIVSEKFSPDEQVYTFKTYKDKEIESRINENLSTGLTKEQIVELSKLLEENEGE